MEYNVECSEVQQQHVSTTVARQEQQAKRIAQEALEHIHETTATQHIFGQPTIGVDAIRAATNAQRPCICDGEAASIEMSPLPNESPTSLRTRRVQFVVAGDEPVAHQSGAPHHSVDHHNPEPPQLRSPISQRLPHVAEEEHVQRPEESPDCVRGARDTGVGISAVATITTSASCAPSSAAPSAAASAAASSAE